MADDKTPQNELDRIRDEVDTLVQEEASEHPEKKKDEAKVSSSFIEGCLKMEELGYGMLYAELKRDELVFNNSTQEWLRWIGHSWERDISERVLIEVEDLVDRLLDEESKLSGIINRAAKEKNEDLQRRMERTRESVYKLIKNLRKDKGRNVCVKMTHTCPNAIAIRGDELDLNPWLLACKNGVINLKSGKFGPGRPEDYISKASPVEWQGIDVPAEKWEAWLLEIFNNDADIVNFLQRVFGYALTGLNIEHFLLMLHGIGRNGKSTLIEIISEILGPLAGAIQSEMLLASRQPKNSGGPSPDIMGLMGLRFAFASETDEGQKFSLSKVKSYTSGDEQVARHPHDKYETRFKPTHSLILLTNHLPQVHGDDFAFWERVYLVPFDLSFVDREPQSNKERRAKKGLADELKKESAGILAWLVRGCLLYQKMGLNPPPIIIKRTKEYRHEEDLLADFIAAEIEKNDYAEESSKDLYDCFSEWYKEAVSEKVIGQKKFGSLMSKKFDKRKSHGRVIYIGLKLRNKLKGVTTG